MSEDQTDQSTGDALKRLVSDILEGRVSLIELLRSAPPGDYWAHVQMQRLGVFLLGKPEVLETLLAEVRQRLVDEGNDPDSREIEKELTRKDGKRRFEKLVNERQHSLAKRTLLTGRTFEECLSQYEKLIGHVEKLWGDACQLHRMANYPLATFVAILVIEEIGKLSKLANELTAYDAPSAPVEPTLVDRSHRRKHFLGVMSGALINARLDRVLGKDIVRKILHDAESDGIEKLRQACLYVDLQDGIAVTPGEMIDEQRSQVFVVLAGELVAEVLGHFPWEFERMIEAAIAFEREIGLPEKRISL